MRTIDPHIIEKDLCTIFSPEWLRNAARYTGLVKRERKIDPMIMFWVLVMKFGVRLQRTRANLKLGYEKASETELSDSSWYERFTPELTEFFKKSASHTIVQLAHEHPDSIPDNLLYPQDIAKYRACRLHRSRTDPADRDPACKFGLDGREIEGPADA